MQQRGAGNKNAPQEKLAEQERELTERRKDNFQRKGVNAQLGDVGQPQPPAGPVAALASLDVEIPRRGTVYRFSTPRGDVQLAARPVAVGLIEAGQRLALVVLFVVAAVWLVRLTRRLHWCAWCERHARGIALTLAAFGLVLLCISPLLGMLLLLIASGLLVRGWLPARLGSC